MRRAGRAGDLRLWAATLLAAAVLGVCGWRLACWVTAPPCYTEQESRWLPWCYRHPDPEALFRRIGSLLRPGEPIVIVAPLGRFETYWWRGMASYFLWDHPIEGVFNTADRHPPIAAGRAVVVLDESGELRVRSRGE